MQTNDYVSPKVEILDVKIENGFVTSPDPMPIDEWYEGEF